GSCQCQAQALFYQIDAQKTSCYLKKISNGFYTILAGPSSDPTQFNFATGKVGSIDDYSSLEINAAVAIDPTKPGTLPTSTGALVDQSTGT
ncbi:MAG: hypothetical protein V7K55_07720, partial [Nostoc sp.]|uniref:hypothetical protein n=1 Tax=Nostoc sp. TaxID=1180 RepID=UPI002FFC0861